MTGIVRSTSDVLHWPSYGWKSMHSIKRQFQIPKTTIQRSNLPENLSSCTFPSSRSFRVLYYTHYYNIISFSWYSIKLSLVLFFLIFFFFRENFLFLKHQLFVGTNNFLIIFFLIRNYVLQKVLGLQNTTHNLSIFCSLKGCFVDFCTQKASSHVVEKCLECTYMGMSYVLKDFLSYDKLWRIARDQYGNYVIQKALKLAKVQFIKIPHVLWFLIIQILPLDFSIINYIVWSMKSIPLFHLKIQG